MKVLIPLFLTCIAIVGSIYMTFKPTKKVVSLSEIKQDVQLINLKNDSLKGGYFLANDTTDTSCDDTTVLKQCAPPKTW